MFNAVVKIRQRIRGAKGSPVGRDYRRQSMMFSCDEICAQPPWVVQLLSDLQDCELLYGGRFEALGCERKTVKNGHDDQAE